MDVVKHFGRRFFNDEVLIAYKKDKDKEDGKTRLTEEIYIEKVIEKIMAVALLKRSDNERYAELN